MADKTIEWLHGVRAQDREEAVLRLLLDRLQPRAASRRGVLGGQVQGQVRPGLGQAARGDLRAPEGARRGAGRGGADAAQRGDARLGRRARQAQAVLLAPDGGLRRLLGERRPQRRSGHRRDRRAGRARQHARHLDLGRQRGEHGGHHHRLVQRADDAERHPADRRDAAPALGALRRHGRLGRGDHGAPLRRGLGVGRQHPVPVGQAGGLAPRRDPQPDGRPLAGPRPGGRRAAVAVRPRHRHRADHPRDRRHPGADLGRRHRAAAAARGLVRGQPDGRRRAGAAHPAVLRVGRQPRRCTRTAGGCRCERPGSHGCSRRRRSRPTPRASGTRTPIRPSSTTCPTTSARRTTWPRRTRTRWPSSRRCSGRRPSATRCCRSWPPCRRSSASCRRCPRPPSSSSGATSRTSSRA